MTPALERAAELLRQSRAEIRELYADAGLEVPTLPPNMTLGDMLGEIRRSLAELDAESLE